VIILISKPKNDDQIVALIVKSLPLILNKTETELYVLFDSGSTISSICQYCVLKCFSINQIKTYPKYLIINTNNPGSTYIIKQYVTGFVKLGSFLVPIHLNIVSDNFLETPIQIGLDFLQKMMKYSNFQEAQYYFQGTNWLESKRRYIDEFLAIFNQFLSTWLHFYAIIDKEKEELMQYLTDIWFYYWTYSNNMGITFSDPILLLSIFCVANIKFGGKWDVKSILSTPPIPLFELDRKKITALVKDIIETISPYVEFNE
jgi:hypothetical protein